MTNLKNYAFYVTDGTGNIVSWTTAAQEMYGFPAEDIIGKHVSHFFTKEHGQKSELQNLLGKAQKSGKCVITGWRYTSNGKLLNVEDTFTLLNSGKVESGGFLVTTKIVLNETEKRPVEETATYELIQELRAIAAYRLNLKEEENAAMAKKIHDELGQQITGLKMDISWLEKKLLQEDEVIRKRIKIIKEMLDNMVKIVRRISADLRPGILDDFGLMDALEWYSNEFEKRTGIKVVFNTGELGINFDKDKTTQLFRVYQGALNSTLNFIDTSIITSNIHIKDQAIEWTIFCDGKEIKKQTDNGRLLIMDLQERMFRLGGDYNVTSIPGEGTTAHISIPLKNL